MQLEKKFEPPSCVFSAASSRALSKLSCTIGVLLKKKDQSKTETILVKAQDQLQIQL